MIFGRFERMVAMRYLRARRQEGFASVIALISFLGIALGVAALIVTMSVMNGFGTDLRNRVLGIGGNITVQGASGPLAGFDAIAAKVRRLPAVTAVNPMVEGQAFVSSAGRGTMGAIRGVRPEDLAARPAIARRLPPDALAGFDQGGVLIGYGLAYALGVRPGQSITLTTSTATKDGIPLLRTQAFKVAGIFRLNLQAYDSGFVFMPLAAAQAYFDMPDAVSGVDVFVQDPDDLEPIETSIRAAVGPGPHLTDWQTRNAVLFSALKVERVVMFIILSLVILVAAFNIVSSMTMLVTNKGYDIGILRTMGATRGMILRIFVLSGASIGVLGTIVGAVLGVAFAANMTNFAALSEALLGRGVVSAGLAMFSQVPALIDPVEVGLVLMTALGLSFLATIYPSLRAAHLDPVKALRGE